MSEWHPPTEDQIRKRAHELYLERESECGGPLDDWLEAEAELLLRVHEEVGGDHLAECDDKETRRKK